MKKFIKRFATLARKSGNKNNFAKEKKNEHELKVHIESTRKEQIYKNNPITLTSEIKQMEMASFNFKSPYKQPKHLSMGFSYFNSNNFLCRPILKKVVDHLENGSKPQIILNGKGGVGKTVLMMQLALHFKENNWCVVYVPQITSWLSGVHPFKFNSQTNLYDQPTATAEYLQFLLNFNEKTLKGINIVDDVIIDDFNYKSNTLNALIMKGIENPELSTLILENTLKILNNNNSNKTLYAIDMFNGFHIKTKYRNTESNPIYADQLSLMALLNDYSETQDVSTVKAFSDWIIFGQEFQHFDYNKGDLVDIQNFSKEETEKILNFYQKSGFIDCFNADFVKKAHFLTGGNGKLLFDFCIEKSLINL